MTDSMNVKNIKCNGTLTFQVARTAIEVDYIQQAINNAAFSGRASQKAATKEAAEKLEALIEQFQKDVKAVSNRLNKAPQQARPAQKRKPKPSSNANTKAGNANEAKPASKPAAAPAAKKTPSKAKAPKAKTPAKPKAEQSAA